MSRTVTLTQLQLQSRQRADKVGSGFILDSELIQYINNSYAELYDLLVGAYDNDYFLSEFPITTVGGTKFYDLPDGFYKLRGIDYNIAANHNLTLRPFQWNERNKFQEGTYWASLVGLNGPRYKISGNQIAFYPAPDGAFNLNLWYIPACPLLVAGTDTVDGVNGFEEYIIIDAAIKMLQKEESDVSILLAQKQAIIARINLMAENRDASQTFRVNDVRTDWQDFDGDTYRY